MIVAVFQKISDIIKADFKNTFTGGNVILQDSTSKPVKVNKTGQFLCFQFDKKNVTIPYFETSVADLCQVSDRVIIYPTTTALFVFIIELKTKNTTGAIKQVRASFELSRYICSTAKRLLNYPEVDIKFRGIIFSNKALVKGTTKPKNLKFQQDDKTELMYKHLQSGSSFDLDNLTF